MEGAGWDLLADEQDVDGAQVEVVKEGKGSQAVVSGVLTGVQLPRSRLAGDRECKAEGRGRTMTVLPLY